MSNWAMTLEGSTKNLSSHCFGFGEMRLPSGGDGGVFRHHHSSIATALLFSSIYSGSIDICLKKIVPESKIGKSIGLEIWSYVSYVFSAIFQIMC